MKHRWSAGGSRSNGHRQQVSPDMTSRLQGITAKLQTCWSRMSVSLRLAAFEGYLATYIALHINRKRRAMLALSVHASSHTTARSIRDGCSVAATPGFPIHSVQ
jgi:hypothetical protein